MEGTEQTGKAMSRAFTQDEIDELWTDEDREDYRLWAEQLEREQRERDWESQDTR